MIKNFISVTSHALYTLPLSQTVTPSQTPSPSSVTYFMDGPLYGKLKEVTQAARGVAALNLHLEAENHTEEEDIILLGLYIYKFDFCNNLL